MIVFGGVRIELATQVVRRDGREIRLTPTEYRLLRTRVRNRDRLLTHDALLRQAWGTAYSEDRQTVRTHMANLRRKLAAPSSSGPIRTNPGVGYLLEDDATLPLSERSEAGVSSSDPTCSARPDYLGKVFIKARHHLAQPGSAEPSPNAPARS